MSSTADVTLVQNDGMLADGSNPEGVEPVPPVSWASKDSLTDVKVVSMPYSPPCTKIRHHLAYHGVPFSVISSKEFKEQKSPYTKVPVIFVGGRQVNDSYIIIKHLTPALYGEEVDEAWDQKITYGLQLAVEIEAFEDPKDYPTIVRFGGFPSFVGWLFYWALPLKTFAKSIRARRAEKEARFGPLRSAKDYALEFRTAIAERPFFSGDQPGSVDVSFYATLSSWREVPSVKRLIHGSDLDAWWARMLEKMPMLDP